MQSLVIDNFLPYPNVVRSWALSKDYYNSEQFSARIGSHTSWPGIRTDHVMDLDSDYANAILTQVSNIARRSFSDLPLSIRSYFQICRESDGDSWIHQDNDVDVAALLYMSPNAPPSSGTTLYRCNDYNAWQSLDINAMKQINRTEKKDLYDSLFTPVDIIGNVYNRLVMYRGDIFHKSNDYFGSTKEDSRLTQVFFLKFDR
jgi:hypothetical protein